MSFISILIGSMGVLDDVVMSQISAVSELYTTDKGLSGFELYKKAMNIGKDHLSSMVNTLLSLMRALVLRRNASYLQ